MKKRIKVLECIRQGQIGGGESHLLSLVENLDQSEFEPVVLSFTDGPMVDKLRQMSVPVHVIPTVKPFDFTKWKKVQTFLKNEQVDIVHAHGTRANSNILWAARSLKIPVIYTVHGWSFHPDQSTLKRQIRILGEKYLTSRSDLTISVSSSNQQTGKQYIPAFSSLVINNGISLEKFNPQRKFKDVRAELRIPEDEKIILFLARFTSHKQPLSLLSAFSEAIRSNEKMHLLMVGDGDEKEEAKIFIEKNKLENKVTLQPFRDDVPDVLAAADIFVLPSLWEGLPIGLLEAMAMSKAIIATRVDGTREIIQDSVNGLLISSKNLIKELTKALLFLCSDEKRVQELGINATKTVQSGYNAKLMTKSIQKVYTEIAEKKF